MQYLKGIIFDVDGTLADTEDVHRQAFNDAFCEFQLDVHWDRRDYASWLFVSGGLERLLRYLEMHAELVPADKSIGDFAADLHRCKTQHYQRRLSMGDIMLRPGVADLIEEAQACGIQLAIATSSSRANIVTLFANLGSSISLDMFHPVVTSDMVADKKPSPAVYQQALQQLGLSSEVCVAIEDTENGMLAAYAAGLEVIVTSHAFTNKGHFPAAAIVVNQLAAPLQLAHGDMFGRPSVDIVLLDHILQHSHTQRQEHVALDGVDMLVAK